MVKFIYDDLAKQINNEMHKTSDAVIRVVTDRMVQGTPATEIPRPVNLGVNDSAAIGGEDEQGQVWLNKQMGEKKKASTVCYS